jgi:hypothetical protein
VAIVWPCPLAVDAYAAAGRDLGFPRPDCPSCAGPLVFWSGYRRYVREAGRYWKIFVPRLRCARCGMSHALLTSSCCAPSPCSRSRTACLGRAARRYACCRRQRRCRSAGSCRDEGTEIVTDTIAGDAGHGHDQRVTGIRCRPGPLRRWLSVPIRNVTLGDKMQWLQRLALSGNCLTDQCGRYRCSPAGMFSVTAMVPRNTPLM